MGKSESAGWGWRQRRCLPAGERGSRARVLWPGIWRGRWALWVWAGGLIGVVEMAFGFFDAGGAPGFGPQGVEDAGDGAGGCDGQQRVPAGEVDQQGEGDRGRPCDVDRGQAGPPVPEGEPGHRGEPGEEADE